MSSILFLFFLSLLCVCFAFFSTFDVHRYLPMFSANPFLVFGFSGLCCSLFLSVILILSPCLPFSLFLPSFFLAVWSANGIITSPSVLDKHQTPPITAFFHDLWLFPLPLSIYLTFLRCLLALWDYSPPLVFDEPPILLLTHFLWHCPLFFFHLNIFLSVSRLLLAALISFVCTC